MRSTPRPNGLPATTELHPVEVDTFEDEELLAHILAKPRDFVRHVSLGGVIYLITSGLLIDLGAPSRVQGDPLYGHRLAREFAALLDRVSTRGSATNDNTKEPSDV